jgi:hypothetical protein
MRQGFALLRLVTMYVSERDGGPYFSVPPNQQVGLSDHDALHTDWEIRGV